MASPMPRTPHSKLPWNDPRDFRELFRGKNPRPFDILAAMLAMKSPRRRRPPEPGRDLMPEPVEPPRPSPLSGGAAAELEFDE